ncbi:MAG: M23 family metallopeptidase [Gemmatimonadaceae bacterium]
MRSLVAMLFAVLASGSAAQTTMSSLNIPAEAKPGSIVRISVDVGAARDSATSVTGTMSGERLHFRELALGTWHAIGAISPDAMGQVSANATINFASGRTDNVSGSTHVVGHPPSHGKPPALSVSTRFTKPMDSATQARVDRENATAREIGRASHDTPPMWSTAFRRPRAAVITSAFGSGRLFNGTLTSRHLGVDFRGKTGDPIVAANRGVVALVGNFFLAGNVVYIDHGAGIVTAYFHMSKTLVANGDTVERGQTIGLVGATGRVTGPHLHWSARYGTLTVNPLDLVALGSSW